MPQYGSASSTATKERFKKPQRYNVIMHNDDFTTMDFVVRVLVSVFFKDRELATRLMLDVHQKGQAIVGTYSYDAATSKANRAMQMARDEGFPFRLTVEPGEDELPF